MANDFDKNKIMHYVKSIGFKSLFDDAKEKIEKNLTTKDEVNKVLF